MRSIQRNQLALPVLWAGTTRNLLFPEAGTDVPFEVRTYPFDDGVETVAHIRSFDVGPGRRFDAYMQYDEGRDCIIDALGTHRTLRTELQFRAAAPHRNGRPMDLLGTADCPRAGAAPRRRGSARALRRRPRPIRD